MKRSRGKELYIGRGKRMRKMEVGRREKEGGGREKEEDGMRKGHYYPGSLSLIYLTVIR